MDQGDLGEPRPASSSQLNAILPSAAPGVRRIGIGSGEDSLDMKFIVSRTNDVCSSASRKNPARLVLLAVLGLMVAAFSLPATAGAFSITSFTVTPSTTQAAAHPDLTVEFGRGGSDREDIKNVVLGLPPGTIANPNAVTTKCVMTYFTSDRCPSASEGGSMAVKVTALGLLPLNVNGSIDVLNPLSTDAGTLGYTLRPIGSAINLISKMYVQNHVTVDPWTQALTSTHFKLPTTAKAVLGLVPVPITIETMKVVLNSRANASKTGKYFVLATSKCGPQTSTLSMTSYQGVTVTGSSVYNSTGCDSVPTAPTFNESFTVLDAEKYTGINVTMTENLADAAQQDSTIKRVVHTFPQGTSLNFPLLNSLTGCTEAQLNAISCPAASKIGTTSSLAPSVGNFSGSIYAMDPIGSTFNFVVYQAGPRGVKAFYPGSASVLGVGPAQRVVVTVDDAPRVPLNTVLHWTSPLLQQPESCGTQTVNIEATGWSGTVSNNSYNYTTVNCAPDTTITSSPASPTNDNTPTFTFTATPATGATFECALDSGAFSSCTSGAALAALADGSYLFRVRACNAIGNCDHTPAEYNLTVDTVAPSVAITSPANGSTVTSSNISPVVATEAGATKQCSLDGSPYIPCATYTGVADGSHTLSAKATDAAGNTSAPVSSTFTVAVGGGPAVPDTQIDVGPRGGLKITDATPTFEFSDLPTGSASSFECSIDGAAFTPCGSPTTVDPLPVAPHTFAVRGVNGFGPDPTPAVASFEVADFTPDVSFEYLDNANNLLTNTQAAQHPDVNIDFTNPAGDPDLVSFQLPDGFWGSLGAAPQCPLSDVSSGSCGAASKIGTLELTAVTDENVAHTFTSDVYLTESPGGVLAGMAGNIHIAFDGKDYGYLRDDALFDFEARYVRDDPNAANVHDPRGINGTANSLPNSTGTYPGPDGSVTMHLRDLKVHLDGETGASIGKPFLTAPSSCDPLSATGDFTDKEATPATVTVPYQATDCNLVAFNPTLTQSYSPVTKGANTAVTATAAVPDQQSTIRDLVLDLPVSVQPQYAGLGLTCLPSDTALIPPACNSTNHKVGTATIDTPLLATPITGDVFLEDSGNALPNLYIYVLDADLGLDVRLRGAVETLGTPSHLRFKMNAEADGSLTDIIDIPVASLTMNLPGSTGQGPILKVSTVCRKTDTTTAGDFTGWSGGTKHVTQTISFDPACPN